MKKLTYAELEAAVAALYANCADRAFASEIDYICDCGRVNASDTIYVEHAAPVENFDSIALASVEEMLCGREVSQRARDWFASAGVRW